MRQKYFLLNNIWPCQFVIQKKIYNLKSMFNDFLERIRNIFAVYSITINNISTADYNDKFL